MNYLIVDYQVGLCEAVPRGLSIGHDIVKPASSSLLPALFAQLLTANLGRIAPGARLEAACSGDFQQPTMIYIPNSASSRLSNEGLETEVEKQALSRLSSGCKLSQNYRQITSRSRVGRQLPRTLINLAH